MFAGINMFWTRRRLILAHAVRLKIYITWECAIAEQTKSAVISFFCLKSKGLNFLFLDLEWD